MIFAALMHELHGGRHDGALIGELALTWCHDLPALRTLALAGPPADRAAAVTVLAAIGQPVELPLDDELLLAAVAIRDALTLADAEGDL